LVKYYTFIFYFCGFLRLDNPKNLRYNRKKGKKAALKGRQREENDMFSMEGPLWRALNLIADVMILHFLWLICSIPLITIGPSTTALYYAMMKRIRTNEGQVTGNFIHSFRQNFRQGVILWLITAAAGVILWLDVNFCANWDGTAAKIMLVGCIALLIPSWMTLLYLFPVLAKFEGTLYTTFKNALLMSVRHLPLTLLLTLIWGTVWLLLVIFPPFTGLMLICGAGFLAAVTAPVYIQVFRVYLPDEVEEDRKRTDNEYLHRE